MSAQNPTNAAWKPVAIDLPTEIDTPLSEKIGARLKVARQLLDVTRRNFAARIGVSMRRLRDVESGASPVSAPIIAAVATGLPQINMEWLMTGQGTILATESTEAATCTGTIAGTITVTDAYDQSEEVGSKIHRASMLMIAMEHLILEGMESSQGNDSQVQLFEVLHELAEVTTTTIKEALDVAGNVTFALSGAHQR